MSNTRRFNQQAAANRVKGSILTLPSRKLRGPTHGLSGDSFTQRRSANNPLHNSHRPTRSLRHSQVTAATKKGAAAHALSAALDTQLHRPLSPGPSFDHEEPFDGSFEPLNEGALSDVDSEEARNFAETAVQDLRVEYRDYRTRRDRTDISNKHWEEQMDEMTKAYMDWCLREKEGRPLSSENGDSMWLDVIDVFGTEYKAIPRSEDRWQSSSLVRSGIIPTAPLVHNRGVSIRTINLYHKLFVRCPKLGMQPFAKALCDVEGSAFRPYLSTELYAAFDVYVGILNRVRKQTKALMGREGRAWRLANSCPSCQYRLKEDDQLEVRIITTMDGNDSLKRVERKEDVLQEREEGGEDLPSASKERVDHRTAGEDYFASRTETNAWDEENWEEMAEVMDVGVVDDVPASLEHLWAEGRCEERWDNMQDKNTNRATGKFFEHGWFVLLCRHMMFLLACDMVKSGELSQYPLALLFIFFKAEQEERERNGEGKPKGKFANAYDINCKFSKTVRRSPLKALAQWALLLPVIGAMHGCAHARLCQLLFLMLYIIGIGLEDGEGCERYYNLSNALAAITRHQSRFHRRQAIAEFIYYNDLQTYSNLSKFIYGNYKQALAIIRTKHALRSSMRESGITSPDVFYEWLVEEGEYLRNLTATPPQETLHTEYYLKLVALQSSQERVAAIRQACLLYVPGSRTSNFETKYRHELEVERKLIADVQVLEIQLDITIRWVEGCEEWKAAKKLVSVAAYQKALDKLEGLLVARIFEMGRLNVAGTGYKLRKHIATAMKTRSKSIRAAITAYNEAAAALHPPRQSISWDQVVEYSFLGEFDILRDTREDVRQRKWASPANRLLMQQFFKLIRAEEELSRLHQEIRRLISYMHDEEESVLAKAVEVEAYDPALALQLRLYWSERGRFNSLHRRRLMAIKKLSGFELRNSKYFHRGTSVKKADVDMTGCEEEKVEEGEEDWEEGEDGGEDEEAELAERVATAMDLAADKE